MLGEKFGEYEIVRLIGRGGMGAVYEALNANINRRAAIKVLHPEFTKEDDAVRRFFNEARAVNTINHPGVVQVSDLGKRPDGSLYLVMELLEGETLTERLQSRGGRLPEREAVTISWQLAGVLAAAHAKSIIHRGPLRSQKQSRNRELIESEKWPGKLGKISYLGLVLDGSEQSRAFIGAHCA